MRLLWPGRIARGRNRLARLAIHYPGPRHGPTMSAVRSAAALPLLALGLGMLQGCIFISDGEHLDRRAEVMVDTGLEDTAPEGPVDADGDGYAEDVDCNDEAPWIHPGAVEWCNGHDDDCDGEVDEDDAADAPAWYADQDGDGYGDLDTLTRACEAPTGHVLVATDCDDADGAIHPDADEICNELDDDCDDEIDEDDAVDASTWYRDEDQDGYGDDDQSLTACEAPSGYVAQAGDCADRQDSVNPEAEELCNGHDDDCDGESDEADAADARSWWADADGDGYGDPDNAVTACDLPSGHVSPSGSGDCDDGDATIHPGASETCDGVDQDCDGTADEGATDFLTWYADYDGDGYGDASATRSACTQPSRHVADASDCDDGDASVHPGAEETCDLVDQDCDGDVDEGATDMGTWYTDADGDGYGDASGATTACRQPSGTVGDGTDCDDSDAGTHPGASETCDGVDQDCDGDVDESAIDMGTWYTDADGDGYGDAASSTTACSQPSGTCSDGSDCDDGDATIHPGATEYCDGVDEDCDGAINTAGTVTHFDSSAVPTDLTASFASGSSRSAANVSLGDDGTVVFCDGTYYAHLEVTASSLYIMGLNGSDHTTISGDGSDTVLNISSNGAIDLYGLTITGGDGGNGGGLYADDPSLSLGITACDFESNQAVQGGGLFVQDATLDLRDSTLLDNAASSDGGGLYQSGGIATLDTVLVEGNESGRDGAGLFAESSTLSLTDCTIDGNASDEDGGGLALTTSDLTVTGGVIQENTADQGGAGLRLQDSTGVIEACGIQDNVAESWGGGILLNASTLDLVSSLVYANEVNGSGLYDVGGGALVYDGSTLTCTGATDESTGFFDNRAGDGGGVYLSGSSDRLDSLECDWGTGTEDNDPDDVDLGFYAAGYSSFGDDETFSCAGGTSGACL